jgi:hypothetical protein
MRKAGVSDEALCSGVKEMKKGLIDADLGGGIFKKRIALPVRGKSGSTRTLVATNRGDRWFFLFGFEKNERGNISNKELEGLKKLAEDYLSLSGLKLDRAVKSGILEKICNDRPE